MAIAHVDDEAMRFSPLVKRTASRGAGAWAIHQEALRRQAAGQEICFLSVGDPDQKPPKVVIQATMKALEDGRTGYSPILGLIPVREAVAARIARRTGHACAADNIAIVPGTQAAMYCALNCIAGPGDEVIVPEPMYATYEGVAGACGATLVNIPLSPERDFHPDIEAVRRAITPRTRAIWINSPHNPTGAVMTRDEVAAIADICRQHRLWLLSDEVYEDLAFAREHVSAWCFDEHRERTIVLSSLSKSHAIPGFRMGWLAGPAALMTPMYNLVLSMLYGTPPFIQLGALPALRADLPEVAALRADYQRRGALVAGILQRAPGCATRAPDGGMFVLLDVRGTGLAGETFARELLDQKAIAVVPCDGFGPTGAGHLRISLTMEDTALAAAAGRIVDLASELAARR